MRKIAAVVLAAGKGTRMNGGNESFTPKVMFEINGIPMIRYTVNNVKKAGVKEIVLVVGYRRDLIEEYFGDEAKYAVQEEQLGTGHAVLMAKDKLAGKSKAVLVCYGDMPMFKPITIQKLVEKYDKEQPTVAMLSVVLEKPNFWAFGRIIRDEKGNVIDSIEQKDCNSEQLKIKESNPCFYIFNAEWLWQNISKLQNDNAQKEYYLTDVVRLAARQGKKIIARPISDPNEAMGINTPEQLKGAEALI